MTTFKPITRRVGMALALMWLHLSAPLAHAQDVAEDVIRPGLERTATEAGFGAEARPIQDIIGDIVNSALALLGLLFMVMLIYAGFVYLTAGGDIERVKKAKKLIGTSIVGLLIVVGAYTLSFFLLGEIIQAVGGGGAS